MSGFTRATCVTIAAAAISGCINSRNTRLPSLVPAPNAIERRSLGHFDPLPDRNLGPETNTRPAEFIEGRDPQRQSLEGQYLEGAPAGPVAPGYPTGAHREGNVVH